MQKGIKNWHLSILIGIISIISVFLVQKYALAQWNDPIGLPGETNGFRLVVNPMTEDLLLNGYDVIDSNLRIDANGTNAIQVSNGANICFDGTNDCISSWSALGGGLWTQNGNDVYYDTGDVGIGTDSPSVALELFASTADGSNLKLRNSAGDMRLIFQEYDTPPTSYGDMSVRYNGTVGGYNNWLEFWGRRPDVDNPIMTMQRDYEPGQNNVLGVGIGVPAETNIDAKLRVQGGSEGEDLLQLYDSSGDPELAVDENGDVGINGREHSGVPLFVNGADSNGDGYGESGLKLYSDTIWAWQRDLQIKGSGDVYTHQWFGLGTTAPQANIHIAADDAEIIIESTGGENAELKLQTGSNTHWGVYQSSTGELNFWNVDNRATLTTDGDLSVSGAIQPGDYDVSMVCNASNYGSIVWNDSCAPSGCLQVCSQTGWLDIATN